MKEKATKYANVILACGYMGQGKTAITKGYIEDFRNRKHAGLPNYGKIAVFDVQDNYKEVIKEADIVIDNEEDDEYLWIDDLMELRCSLIMLDDFKELMPEDRLNKRFKKFLMRAAEYGNTIFLMCHSPFDITKRLRPYIHQYLIFKTVGDMTGLKHYVSADEKVFVILNEIITKEVDENDIGVYPECKYIYHSSFTKKSIPYNFESQILPNEGIEDHILIEKYAQIKSQENGFRKDVKGGSKVGNKEEDKLEVDSSGYSLDDILSSTNV